MNSSDPSTDPYQQGWEQNVTKRYFRYYTYIEPALKDPVIKGYFTLVASILLTAFFIFFALSPTFSTIVGLTRKITDQGKLLSTMDAKISSLIVAQENFSQLEPDLPILNAALPEKPHPETILSELLQISSGSGVKISSFQFKPVNLQGEIAPTPAPAPMSAAAAKTSVPFVPSVGIPPVEFSLTVSGSLPQIRVFLGKAESLPRIITLYLVSVNKNSTSKSQDMTADIAGAGYFLNSNFVTDNTPNSKNARSQ